MPHTLSTTASALQLPWYPPSSNVHGASVGSFVTASLYLSERMGHMVYVTCMWGRCKEGVVSIHVYLSERIGHMVYVTCVWGRCKEGVVSTHFSKPSDWAHGVCEMQVLKAGRGGWVEGRSAEECNDKDNNNKVNNNNECMSQ
eukprot:364688-Chlamydomonas_euryale.AAC.1